jgi:hypothetical protein
MSTVVVGGGGPRPQARIVGIVESEGAQVPGTWAVMDGDQVLWRGPNRAWAEALLPAIQAGD